MADLEKIYQKVNDICYQIYAASLREEKMVGLLEEQNRLMRLYLKSKGIQVEQGVETDKNDIWNLFMHPE